MADRWRHASHRGVHECLEVRGIVNTGCLAHMEGYITFACLELLIHPTFPRLAMFAPMVVFPWTYMISMSGVRLGHHTQIAVGTLLGVC
ncbi:hypothetical protein EDD22DRAFT_787872 [Suillus occidentalis]|nr:hypothetical protein EDD22DRAFT_787872 [Suillus occidentalis]